MRDFLRNLLLLMVIAVALYLVSPKMMGQIFQLFNGLGILPLFLIMVIVAALPKRRRRRR